jgi:hypothetical protein
LNFMQRCFATTKRIRLGQSHARISRYAVSEERRFAARLSSRETLGQRFGPRELLHSSMPTGHAIAERISASSQRRNAKRELESIHEVSELIDYAKDYGAPASSGLSDVLTNIGVCIPL